ncbi:MAG: hypothetical protein FWG30_01290 [Eubacteriaceae bacterium]|nr:hypothetical protein [Eubacteriaceae bacterium]
MKKAIAIIALVLSAFFLFACSSATNELSSALPMPDVDTSNMFGVDKNINMNTIDSYLGRDDVEYIDVRLLFDSADFGAIGGEADLTRTIHGFHIVPYPYIATLSELPVSGAYDGPCLYALTWNADGSIASATPNFLESELIMQELFPKGKAVFIMCGGGGYSGMIKSLLIYLGWDENYLYNIGGNWGYEGSNTLELTIFPEDAAGNKIYATWRANYAYIDFTRLHQISDD